MNILFGVLFLVSVCHSAYQGTREKFPIVKTPLGDIKGSYGIAINGRQYESYLGVPYALPPIGNLRFEPPVMQTPWEGTLLATKLGSLCLQYSHVPTALPERVEGAEDCLYINIFKPVQEKNASAIPVIFWLHGGAFQFGSGKGFGPRYLLSGDVILVTVNYRLGPFGFLSTEDEVVPGNMGLKDQNMALRWLSSNIASFNGDPKRITIAGQSAGGASVHYHYLSPLSANLFHNGISLSGTALDCWTQTENSLEKAKKLSSIVGCPTGNIRKMIKCMKTRPSRSLSQATEKFMPWLYNPYTPFGPVVEKGGPAPFLDKSPIEIITSGGVHDIPWITSVVSEEGLYPGADFAVNDALLKELNNNWLSIAPHLLDYNYTIPLQKQDKVSKYIKEHYLGLKPIDRSTNKELIQLIGDRLFVADGAKAAKLMAKHMKSPVHFYYFTYRGAHSLSELLSHTSENLGVSHADDLYYVLYGDTVKTDTTASDLKMQREMTAFWLSYAATSFPKVPISWPAVKSDNFTYLHIYGPGSYKVESSSNFGQEKFWNSIGFNENEL